MNPWPFVIAAYAISAVGIGGLWLHAWLGMRRAERAANALSGDRP